MIKVVRITGTQIHWDEIEQEESLEGFARKRNDSSREMLREMGCYRDLFRFDVTYNRVEESDMHGSIIATYRRCETDPHRLL